MHGPPTLIRYGIPLSYRDQPWRIALGSSTEVYPGNVQRSCFILGASKKIGNLSLRTKSIPRGQAWTLLRSQVPIRRKRIPRVKMSQSVGCSSQLKCWSRPLCRCNPTRSGCLQQRNQRWLCCLRQVHRLSCQGDA